MKRALAILLVTLFTLPAMVSAFARPEQTNLPACCLKAGKHHCAVGAQAGKASPGWNATSRCSLFQQNSFLPDDRSAFAARRHRLEPVRWQVSSLHYDARPDPQTVSNVVERKRGPPSSFSSVI